MSYHIFYNKQFIKISEHEVIPIFLSGDNNVTEYRNGKESRARDWHSWNYYNDDQGSKCITGAKNLIMNVENWIEKECRENAQRSKTADYMEEVTEQQVAKAFGYYTSMAKGGGHTGSFTANQFLSLFKNGVKTAMTVEELLQAGIHIGIDIHTAYCDVDIKPAFFTLPNTTEELLSHIEYAENYCKTVKATYNGKPTTIGYSISFVGDWENNLNRLKRYRKSLRPQKEKMYVTQDHYYVLANEDGYLYKYTARGYRYSSYPGGKCFRTEKEAQKYLNNLIKKRKHKCNSWQIEKINRTAQFKEAV